MKPGIFNLPTIWRGSDYQLISFQWLNASSGLPQDLTGWVPFAKSLNVDFHPVVTNPMTGVATISLTKEETALLPLGVEAWDWTWLNSNNGRRTNPLITGKVEIKEPVSN